MWGFVDPMHLLLNDSIFNNFCPKFWTRCWDIFSISGNAMINLFFSIVISCEKAKIGCCEVLRIPCTVSLKISIFHNYWLSNFGQILGPDFEIFSQFQEMRWWITTSSIVITCEKGKIDSCEVLRIWCTFSLNIQFFIIIGLILGPDFEIFSQFH